MATGAKIGYCRVCESDQPFHVHALLDADTNGRPGAIEHRCAICGLVVLALADLPDAVGICEVVVSRWLRRQSVRADAPWLRMAREDGASIAPNNRVDPDDARSHLFEQLWRMYRAWDPAKVAFTPYASQWLPRRLDDWIGNATGDVTRGGKRRTVPKLAPELLDDELGIGIGDDAARTSAAAGDRHEQRRLVAALGGRESDYADDRNGDLRGLLSGGDRERIRREPDRRVQAARRAS